MPDSREMADIYAGGVWLRSDGAYRRKYLAELSRGEKAKGEGDGDKEGIRTWCPGDLVGLFMFVRFNIHDWDAWPRACDE